MRTRRILGILLTASCLTILVTHSAVSAATPGRRDLSAFRGLGTWVDAYDFSNEENPKTAPPVAPSAVGAMARDGVKTLYIQAAKNDSNTPNATLSAKLLGSFLIQAHGKGLKVVAWYLPTFTSPTSDWDHIKAILDFRADGQRFDGFGMDIESRANSDVAARNTRLINLTAKTRAYVGDRVPLSAIVLPPVVTDVINKQYWPSFPWAAIKANYDVWQPMAYFTNRTKASGYRDPYTYMRDNISLLRKDLKSPIAAVHAVGGIGDQSSTADYVSMIRGLKAGGSIGGSVYDWNTTAASAWPILRTVP